MRDLTGAPTYTYSLDDDIEKLWLKLVKATKSDHAITADSSIINQIQNDNSLTELDINGLATNRHYPISDAKTIVNKYG